VARTEPGATGPLRAAKDGVRIAVRVQPRASRARIAGPVERAGGALALKVHVTEAPADGRANAALVKILAKAWGVPKGSVRVVAGAKERDKVVHVAGDPVALHTRLSAWLAGLDPRRP